MAITKAQQSKLKRLMTKVSQDSFDEGVSDAMDDDATKARAKAAATLREALAYVDSLVHNP